MTIAKKKARRSNSESLEGSSPQPQPYVVPETAIRDLVSNLRIGEAHDAATCLLVIGEALKGLVRDKTETGELNLRLIKQMAAEEECRPIQRIIEGIVAALEHGAEGIYAACLTITRFLEFAFEYQPDQRGAERLYKNKLNKIRHATQGSN
jgi:hypothetical protein